MGAKTGMVVFTDGDVAAALREPVQLNRDEAAGLVRQVLPGYGLEDVDPYPLGDAVYPPEEAIYTGTIGGTTILCDQRFMIDKPSELPEHIVNLANGRRIILHAMHSVVDWFAYAIWDRGTIVRSLSLSPDDGIIENIGEPLSFEGPYWAGEHPVVPIPGWPDQGPYPLPFHPLELGEDALRALFGFVLEGMPEPNDVDPYTVQLTGFRAIDPSGAEQTRHEERMEAVRDMPTPRMFRYIDGRMVEVNLEGQPLAGPDPDPTTPSTP